MNTIIDPGTARNYPGFQGELAQMPGVVVKGDQLEAPASLEDDVRELVAQYDVLLVERRFRFTIPGHYQVAPEVDGVQLVDVERDGWRFVTSRAVEMIRYEADLSSGGTAPNPTLRGTLTVTVKCRPEAQFGFFGIGKYWDRDLSQPDLLAEELGGSQAARAFMEARHARERERLGL